jgi:hypothetical protein
VSPEIPQIKLEEVVQTQTPEQANSLLVIHGSSSEEAWVNLRIT